MTLLRIRDLRRLHLGPLSLEVDGGECVCLTGASGSGKSQLLRSVADLDRHEGELWLEGVASQSMRADAWRRRVGLLPPESAWWLPRAIDHFADGGASCFERYGLAEEILEQPVERLSSGEKQRLALMRLLANRPRVLLLDEPTANLDPASSRRVENVLAEYRRHESAGVLWVSHDLEEVERVADRHFALEDGRLHPRSVRGRE